MKKLLLPLLISSVLAISACDDKNLGSKVFEGEKQIVQLKAELAQKEKAFATLQAENTRLQAELSAAQNAKADFPSLKVSIEPLYQKAETLEFGKDPEDEFERQTNIVVSAHTPVTNIAWLDQLLLNEVATMWVSQEEGKIPQKDFSREDISKMAADVFKEYEDDAKEYKPAGLERTSDADYLGQRNNIAMFSLMHHNYTGGAHGIYYTRYLNIDTDKKSLITLDRLVPPANQAKLKTMLWEEYVRQNPEASEWYKSLTEFADRKEFRISDNFLINNGEITFFYPVYELGPFVAGEVEISLSRGEINALLSPEYQYNEKDGFYLSLE